MSVFSIRRPSADTIARSVAAALDQTPDHPDVGRIALGARPAGYRRARVSREVGCGVETVARVATALDAWAAPAAIGATIHPADAVPTLGATIVQVLRVGPLWATAACRIVWRVDTPGHVGYAYGALAQHPVRGEEVFEVVMDAAGVVRVVITVVARPRAGLFRLAGPLGFAVERIAARRYLTALARAARP